MPHTLPAFLSSFPVRKKICATLLSALTALFCLSLPMSVPLHAQIVTDGTLGPAMTLSGPNMVIPQDLGTLAGQNLFHSFRTFGIPMGESATFTGADGIANVISRVTGGEASHIDGLLRSEVGRADFFFINPSGVVFGPAARVHVPAAFYVSTAHELKFVDGASFNAINPQAGTLTQAAPEAFGFLGDQPADIMIYGSQLGFQDKSKVSLVSSGDIIFAGSTDMFAELMVPSGEILLSTRGDMLIDTAIVSTIGDGGGKITIHAENVRLAMGFLSAGNTGDRYANGGVFITATELINILDGVIDCSTEGKGNAGPITIYAKDMNISGLDRFMSGISSVSLNDSEGNAGDIKIVLDGLLNIKMSGYISNNTYSIGKAGQINIQAKDMTIDGQGSQDFTGVASGADPGSEGNAGTVEITVSGLMQLLNGGIISSSTLAKGNAGEVTVNASTLILDGSRITSDATSTGQVGNVTVNAGSVHLRNNSSISIEAHQMLPPERLSEPERILTVNAWNANANTLSLDGGSKISTESTGNVPAADIVVCSSIIDIRGDSSVSTSALDADGGAVTLLGGTIFLDDGLVTTSVEGLTGDGGDIIIGGLRAGEPADFLIMNHGFIQANTAAPGAVGGNIDLNVRWIIADRSGGSLVVDAVERMDYWADAPRSVIQAAAPGGTKGDINVSDASLLDISGSIIPMRSQVVQPIGLSTDPCDIDPVREKPSSLVLEGVGGLPEEPGDLPSVPFDGTRLDGLMEPSL